MALPNTYHVYCRAGVYGEHYIVRYAQTKEEARKSAEADGHVVTRVRVAPNRPRR